MWAVLLVAVDAFVLNMGVISFFVGAWAVMVAFPRAIFYVKDPALKRDHLARAAIFLVASALVLWANSANNKVAHSRAETVIAAVKAFHRQNQRYPETLEELVPDFINEIPPPKYVLRSSFRYKTFPDGAAHYLIYSNFPPFGRRVYIFETDQWGSMD